MELRQYWDVIWRRRWLVLVVIALATLFSAYTLLTTPRTYEAEGIFAVRFPADFSGTGGSTAEPNPPGGAVVFRNEYGAYYYYLSSEYQVDDFTQVVESDMFASAVLRTLKEDLAQGRIVVSDTTKLKNDLDKLRSGDLISMMGADRRHRELRVFVAAPSRDLARYIIDTTGIVLTEARYEPVRGRILDQPVFAQLDEITYDDVSSSTSKEITNAIIRVVMGVVAALALAFLIEYLDNSIRDERDARKVLDLPVIGAIPRT